MNVWHGGEDDNQGNTMSACLINRQKRFSHICKGGLANGGKGNERARPPESTQVGNAMTPPSSISNDSWLRGRGKNRNFHWKDGIQDGSHLQDLQLESSTWGGIRGLHAPENHEITVNEWPYLAQFRHHRGGNIQYRIARLPGSQPFSAFCLQIYKIRVFTRCRRKVKC